MKETRERRGFSGAMRIVISPFSRKLRTDDPNRENAKHYAHWERLLRMIKEAFPDSEIIQIGVDGEKILPGVDRTEFSLSFREVAELIKSCDLWISVDNFLPHLCNSYFRESKPGIVIFTRSDPNIYGYAHNFNVLKSRKYLRPDQFGIWESCSYDPNSSPDPETVLQVISKLRLEDSF